MCLNDWGHIDRAPSEFFVGTLFKARSAPKPYIPPSHMSRVRHGFSRQDGDEALLLVCRLQRCLGALDRAPFRQLHVNRLRNRHAAQYATQISMRKSSA